ncbi:hypothetical protein [Vulcanococcus sp.]|uniref:hyaluronate lyase N-terminal domain-containing protein n=1 Tax=Vulcanococcus sp. TaxID=2856995 RepID=UPI003F6A4C55
MSDTITRFKLRNGTAAAWTAANPVLLLGEIGIETDTRRYKIGDGTTAWSSLSYYIEGVLARGQASKMTSGTIAIAQAGTFQSTGLAATFDAASDYQVVLGTSDTFGLKNASGSTKLFTVQASMDATAGNNQTLGIKLAKNGSLINESECRAYTGSSGQVAKLFCFWMIELADGDEVAMYVANITNTTSISFQRGRISAVEVKA